MKDTLSQQDVELFYRLKHSLYIFVNNKINAFPASNDWKEVYNQPMEKIKIVRDYIFTKHKELIDEFVKENQFNLNNEELDIISSWKDAIVADRFILFKHLKEHTLFFGKDKVYAVVGLMDSFKDIFQGHAPLFIDLIILPFKEVLTHEGLFIPYRVTFGGNMRSSIKAEAEEVIQKYGITTSLKEGKQDKKVSDEELLRFYLKSEPNRDRFWKKIDELASKSKSLQGVYNHEMGRANSRNIKSQIKKQKIKGHFAVLFSQVIASAATKRELQKNIDVIIPEDRRAEVYVFQVR